MKKTKPRGVSKVRGGKAAAARTVRLLASILAFAQERGLLAHNPARGVKLEPMRRRERFLSGAELARLGGALAAMEREGENKSGLNIIRLLALTGARKGEMAHLQWSEVDFDGGFLRLTDSKTGPKILPLSPPALAVLDGLPRYYGSPFVFPAARGGSCYQNVGHVWEKARARAGLEGVRLHDLRHTYASFGAAASLGLPVIGALLGHSQPSTTQRYAHLAESPVRLAAARISGVIAAHMGGPDAQEALEPEQDGDGLPARQSDQRKAG